MMAGLPGSGKSTLARALAKRSGGIVLDKDLIRARLFPAERIEYSTTQDDFVVEVILNTAEYLLQQDPTTVVILDGRPFSRKYQVNRVVARAKQMSTAWRIVECVCPEKIALRRLKVDLAGLRHVAGNRGAALYREVKVRWEEIRRPKLVVKTSLRLDGCVRQVEEYLRLDKSYSL
jgi:adenylylsulfate kinase